MQNMQSYTVEQLFYIFKILIENNE